MPKKECAPKKRHSPKKECKPCHVKKDDKGKGHKGKKEKKEKECKLCKVKKCKGECKEKKCESRCAQKDCSPCKVKKCEPKCCLPCCVDEPCDHYTGFEIACRFRAAVVSVASELVLTDQAANGTIVADQLRTYRNYGTGAFINEHLILTSSALVIAPPTVLTTNNRFPFTSPSVPVASGNVPAELVQMSKILVTVHNLNGRATPSRKTLDGHAVTYEASLVMVDGAGGYALLRIDCCSEWNRCLPQIKPCHPSFCIGQSRKLRSGDDVYLLGEFTANRGVGQGSSCCVAITKGVVSYNKGSDRNGWFLPEFVIVDAAAFSPAQGMPLVNKFGQLVGLQIASTPGVVPDLSVEGFPAPGLARIGAGATAAVSEFFMRRAIKATLGLLKCDPCESEKKLKCHLGLVVDTGAGNFHKYLKGYAGIAYNIVDGSDFNTYLRDPTTGARGALLNSMNQLYNGPKDKDVRGIRTVTLAGNNTITYAYVPGTGAVLPYVGSGVADSNFLATIAPEDLIVTINRGMSDGKGCTLGEEARQIVPALFTWQLLPNDYVILRVRRVNQTAGVAASDHLNVEDCVQAALQVFPPVMDYPWGLINLFPLVNDPYNPAPVPLVIPFPQLPSLNFYPAF